MSGRHHPGRGGPGGRRNGMSYNDIRKTYNIGPPTGGGGGRGGGRGRGGGGRRAQSYAERRRASIDSEGGNVSGYSLGGYSMGNTSGYSMGAESAGNSSRGGGGRGGPPPGRGVGRRNSDEGPARRASFSGGPEKPIRRANSGPVAHAHGGHGGGVGGLAALPENKSIRITDGSVPNIDVGDGRGGPPKRRLTIDGSHSSRGSRSRGSGRLRRPTQVGPHPPGGGGSSRGSFGGPGYGPDNPQSAPIGGSPGAGPAAPAPAPAEPEVDPSVANMPVISTDDAASVSTLGDPLEESETAGQAVVEAEDDEDGDGEEAEMDNNRIMSLMQDAAGEDEKPKPAPPPPPPPPQATQHPPSPGAAGPDRGRRPTQQGPPPNVQSDRAVGGPPPRRRPTHGGPPPPDGRSGYGPQPDGGRGYHNGPQHGPGGGPPPGPPPHHHPDDHRHHGPQHGGPPPPGRGPPQRRPTHGGPPPGHHPGHGPGPPGGQGHPHGPGPPHHGPGGPHRPGQHPGSGHAGPGAPQHFTGSEDAIRRIHAQSSAKFSLSVRSSFNTRESHPDSALDGDGGGYFDGGDDVFEATYGVIESEGTRKRYFWTRRRLCCFAAFVLLAGGGFAGAGYFLLFGPDAKFGRSGGNDGGGGGEEADGEITMNVVLSTAPSASPPAGDEWDGDGNPVPEPPPDLGGMCGPGNMPGSYGACESACGRAACCFLTSEAALAGDDPSASADGGNSSAALGSCASLPDGSRNVRCDAYRPHCLVVHDPWPGWNVGILRSLPAGAVEACPVLLLGGGGTEEGGEEGGFGDGAPGDEDVGVGGDVPDAESGGEAPDGESGGEVPDDDFLFGDMPLDLPSPDGFPSADEEEAGKSEEEAGILESTSGAPSADEEGSGASDSEVPDGDIVDEPALSGDVTAERYRTERSRIHGTSDAADDGRRRASGAGLRGGSLRRSLQEQDSDDADDAEAVDRSTCDDLCLASACCSAPPAAGAPSLAGMSEAEVRAVTGTVLNLEGAYVDASSGGYVLTSCRVGNEGLCAAYDAMCGRDGAEDGAEEGASGAVTASIDGGQNDATAADGAGPTDGPTASSRPTSSGAPTAAPSGTVRPTSSSAPSGVTGVPSEGPSGMSSDGPSSAPAAGGPGAVAAATVPPTSAPVAGAGEGAVLPAATVPATISYLPPANTLDIASRCGGGALASGDVAARVSCASACGAGTCCFPDLVQADGEGGRVGSCFVGNEEACLDYLPCLALVGLELDAGGDGGGNGEGDPPAPEVDLGELCSGPSTADVAGYVGCRTACLAGRCCHSASCDESGSDVCPYYSPCEGVFGSMADATEDGPEGEGGGRQEPLRDGAATGSDGQGTGEAAPSPPDDLDAAVAASAEDADASVATASPAGADGPSDLPDPEDLDLVCGISEKLCREACEVASCCFEAEGSPAQCRDDPHCAGYLPCSEFYVDP